MIECKICGKEFKPHSGMQIYCSHDCSKTAKRERNRKYYCKHKCRRTNTNWKNQLEFANTQAINNGLTYGQYVSSFYHPGESIAERITRLKLEGTIR